MCHYQCTSYLHCSTIIGDNLSSLDPKINKHLSRKHWEMFPDLCLIRMEILDEIKELMLHATCGQYLARNGARDLNTTSDRLTTTRSAAALSADELKQYFDIVKWIRGNSTSPFPARCGNLDLQ